jgi:hypothetical protein
MVVGGSDASNNPTAIVELYYPASQCTVRLHDAPRANTNPILCFINGVIYLGINSVKIAMYTYDFVNDDWIDLEAVSTYDHSRDAFACGDSYLCVTNDVYPECFYPSTKTWSTRKYITNNVGVESCIVHKNGILYSFGGTNTKYNNYYVQYLDVNANSWTVVNAARMPAYTVMGGCHLIPGTNKILVTIDGTSPNACIYNTNTNSFESCTSSQVVLSQSDVVASSGPGNQLYAFDFTTPKYIGAYAYCPSSASPWQQVSLGTPITTRYYFSVVSFSCSLIPAGKFPVSCNPVDFTCV